VKGNASWSERRCEPALIDYLSKVREFHRAFRLPASATPIESIDDRVRRTRINLVKEEVDELIAAMKTEDLVAIADELADVLYVVFGTAVTYGIPIDAVFEEVHRSNMTKLGEDGTPIIAESGKCLKGPNYEKPRIDELLRRH
jgi:predicted HAD superfamily Cof-like phosphohydrolase